MRGPKGSLTYMANGNFRIRRRDDRQVPYFVQYCIIEVSVAVPVADRYSSRYTSLLGRISFGAPVFKYRATPPRLSWTVRQTEGGLLYVVGAPQENWREEPWGVVFRVDVHTHARYRAIPWCRFSRGNGVVKKCSTPISMLFVVPLSIRSQTGLRPTRRGEEGGAAQPCVQIHEPPWLFLPLLGSSWSIL